MIIVKNRLQQTAFLILYLAVFFSASRVFAGNGFTNFEQLQKQVNPTALLYPEPEMVRGQLLLTDDNKEQLLLSERIKDKWIILYFGYRSCPDVCPIDLAVLHQTVKKMKEDTSQLQVVFVSVDPQRDLGHLSSFVTQFNPGFIGLTAENDTLDRITKKLNIYYEIVATRERMGDDHSQHARSAQKDNHAAMGDDHAGNEKEDSYLIQHSASYILLSPDYTVSGILTNPHKPDKMATALDKIISNWKKAI